MAEITIDSYVLDVLMRESPSAFLVYLHIWSQTFGKGQQSAALSHRRMAESTGLSRSAVQGAVRILCRRRLLRAHKPTVTSTPEYAVQRPWREVGAAKRR